MNDVRPACTIDGVPWWDFSFVYHWDGAEYLINICARSREEAEARIKCLPLARYVGQVDGSPVRVGVAGAAWLRFKAWWMSRQE